VKKVDSIFNIKGINGDIEVNLSVNSIDLLENSSGSIIVPFYKGNYVMTYHPKRSGWEFPGGKREVDETIIECVTREAFEEAGAIVSNIEPIGYYSIKTKDKVVKTAIFTGHVERFEPKPRWSETDLVKIFDKLPAKLSFSDDVYKIVLEYLEETVRKNK